MNPITLLHYLIYHWSTAPKCECGHTLMILGDETVCPNCIQEEEQWPYQ